MENLNLVYRIFEELHLDKIEKDYLNSLLKYRIIETRAFDNLFRVYYQIETISGGPIKRTDHFIKTMERLEYIPMCQMMIYHDEAEDGELEEAEDDAYMGFVYRADGRTGIYPNSNGNYISCLSFPIGAQNLGKQVLEENISKTYNNYLFEEKVKAIDELDRFIAQLKI